MSPSFLPLEDLMMEAGFPDLGLEPAARSGGDYFGIDDDVVNNMDDLEGGGGGGGGMEAPMRTRSGAVRNQTPTKAGGPGGAGANRMSQHHATGTSPGSSTIGGVMHTSTPSRPTRHARMYIPPSAAAAGAASRSRQGVSPTASNGGTPTPKTRQQLQREAAAFAASGNTAGLSPIILPSPQQQQHGTPQHQHRGGSAPRTGGMVDDLPRTRSGVPRIVDTVPGGGGTPMGSGPRMRGPMTSRGGVGRGTTPLRGPRLATAGMTFIQSPMRNPLLSSTVEPFSPGDEATARMTRGRMAGVAAAAAAAVRQQQQQQQQQQHSSSSTEELSSPTNAAGGASSFVQHVTGRNLGASASGLYSDGSGGTVRLTRAAGMARLGSPRAGGAAGGSEEYSMSNPDISESGRGRRQSRVRTSSNRSSSDSSSVQNLSSSQNSNSFYGGNSSSINRTSPRFTRAANRQQQNQQQQQDFNSQSQDSFSRSNRTALDGDSDPTPPDLDSSADLFSSPTTSLGIRTTRRSGGGSIDLMRPTTLEIDTATSHHHDRSGGSTHHDSSPLTTPVPSCTVGGGDAEDHDDEAMEDNDETEDTAADEADEAGEEIDEPDNDEEEDDEEERASFGRRPTRSSIKTRGGGVRTASPRSTAPSSSSSSPQRNVVVSSSNRGGRGGGSPRRSSPRNTTTQHQQESSEQSTAAPATTHGGPKQVAPTRRRNGRVPVPTNGKRPITERLLTLDDPSAHKQPPPPQTQQQTTSPSPPPRPPPPISLQTSFSIESLVGDTIGGGDSPSVAPIRSSSPAGSNMSSSTSRGGTAPTITSSSSSNASSANTSLYQPSVSSVSPAASVVLPDHPSTGRGGANNNNNNKSSSRQPTIILRGNAPSPTASNDDRGRSASVESSQLYIRRPSSPTAPSAFRPYVRQSILAEESAADNNAAGGAADQDSEEADDQQQQQQQRQQPENASSSRQPRSTANTTSVRDTPSTSQAATTAAARTLARAARTTGAGRGRGKMLKPLLQAAKADAAAAAAAANAPPPMTPMSTQEATAEHLASIIDDERSEPADVVDPERTAKIIESHRRILRDVVLNKVNLKNAFDYPFEDNLEYLKMTKNFQTMGTIIDANAKIYSYRVDHVSQVAHRITGGLGRKERKFFEDNVESRSDSEQDDPTHSEYNPNKKKKKQTKRWQGKTIERNEANINIDGAVGLTLHLHAGLTLHHHHHHHHHIAFGNHPEHHATEDYEDDALFRQVVSKYDEGGSNGLLLNNIDCGPDTKPYLQLHCLSTPADTAYGSGAGGSGGRSAVAGLHDLDCINFPLDSRNPLNDLDWASVASTSKNKDHSSSSSSDRTIVNNSNNNDSSQSLHQHQQQQQSQSSFFQTPTKLPLSERLQSNHHLHRDPFSSPTPSLQSSNNDQQIQSPPAINNLSSSNRHGDDDDDDGDDGNKTMTTNNNNGDNSFNDDADDDGEDLDGSSMSPKPRPVQNPLIGSLKDFKFFGWNSDRGDDEVELARKRRRNQILLRHLEMEEEQVALTIYGGGQQQQQQQYSDNEHHQQLMDTSESVQLVNSGGGVDTNNLIKSPESKVTDYYNSKRSDQNILAQLMGLPPGAAVPVSSLRKGGVGGSRTSSNAGSRASSEQPTRVLRGRSDNNNDSSAAAELDPLEKVVSGYAFNPDRLDRSRKDAEDELQLPPMNVPTTPSAPASSIDPSSQRKMSADDTEADLEFERPQSPKGSEIGDTLDMLSMEEGEYSNFNQDKLRSYDAPKHWTFSQLNVAGEAAGGSSDGSGGQQLMGGVNGSKRKQLMAANKRYKDESMMAEFTQWRHFNKLLEAVQVKGETIDMDKDAELQQELAPYPEHLITQHPSYQPAFFPKSFLRPNTTMDKCREMSRAFCRAEDERAAIQGSNDVNHDNTSVDYLIPSITDQSTVGGGGGPLSGEFSQCLDFDNSSIPSTSSSHQQQDQTMQTIATTTPTALLSSITNKSTLYSIAYPPGQSYLENRNRNFLASQFNNNNNYGGLMRSAGAQVSPPQHYLQISNNNNNEIALLAGPNQVNVPKVKYAKRDIKLNQYRLKREMWKILTLGNDPSKVASGGGDSGIGADPATANDGSSSTTAGGESSPDRPHQEDPAPSTLNGILDLDQLPSTSTKEQQLAVVPAVDSAPEKPPRDQLADKLLGERQFTEILDSLPPKSWSPDPAVHVSSAFTIFLFLCNERTLELVPTEDESDRNNPDNPNFGAFSNFKIKQAESPPSIEGGGGGQDGQQQLSIQTTEHVIPPHNEPSTAASSIMSPPESAKTTAGAGAKRRKKPAAGSVSPKRKVKKT